MDLARSLTLLSSMALLKLGRAEDAKVAFQTGLSVPNLDDANKNGPSHLSWADGARIEVLHFFSFANVEKESRSSNR